MGRPATATAENYRPGRHGAMSASAITLCPVTRALSKSARFARANQVCSGFYLDLDLSACHGDTASIPPLADAKTGTDISDIHCTNFHLQFAGVVVFDIKISVASQQFNPGRLGIGDSDTAVGIQTDRRYQVLR